MTTRHLQIRTVIVSIITFLVMIGAYVFAREFVGSSGAFDRFVIPLFFATVAAHATTLVLNAARLTHSLNLGQEGSAPARMPQILDAMVLHNFLVSFLPARMADGYYPFLIAHRAHVSTGVGLGNLLVIRLFDVMAIGLIIVALAPMVMSGGQLEQLYAVLVPIILALIVAVAAMTRLLTIALYLSQPTLHRLRLGRKLSRALNQARHWVDRFNLRQRFELGFFSLVPWLASGFTYIFAIKAIGVDVAWAEVMFAGKLAEIDAAIPVQAAGGIGAGEGMMAAVMVGYGLPIAAAGLAALGVRFIVLGAVATIFALRCGAVLMFSGRRGQSVLGRIFGPDVI